MCRTLGWRIGDTRPGAAQPCDRVYTTYRGAVRAAARRGPTWTVVERACDCPRPRDGDAAGWDAYRLRHGYSGAR
jgi:hypothetical protein